MRYAILFSYCFLIAGLLLLPAVLSAQVPDLAPKTTTTTPGDSMVTVEILPGVRKLEFRKINDSTQLQILAGNVKLKQGNTLFDCDSCVIDNSNNIFEAWGHVHINDADTSNVYSSHLRYLIRKKVAYLDGGVTLTDGKGTLTTPDLEYDVDTKIGIYKNGGKVVNKTTVLTSVEGYYYTDLKDVYFKKNVELKDPAYFIKTDSLLYNTESSTARFISETFIRDSSGRTINTREGFYDMKTGKAEFGQRPVIRDGKIMITANRIASDDSTGISQAEGNAVIIDSVNQTTIIAGMIFRNKKTESILALMKPLMIIKQDKDSIFVTADTLFSARLTDLYAAKRKDSLLLDSIYKVNALIAKQKDSLHQDSIKVALLAKAQKDSLSTRLQPPPLATRDTVAWDTLMTIHAVTPGNTMILDSLNRLTTIRPVNADSIQPDIPNLANLRMMNDRDSTIVDSAGKIKLVPTHPTDSLALKNAQQQFRLNKASPDSLIDSASVKAAIKARLNSVATDTLTGKQALSLNEKDSTNRYFEAYRHVRIFSDSMQAVSDSLFYSFKDSVFRMFQHPVLWSNKSQITGDTVYLFTRNKKADRAKVFNNSFMVNRLDPEVFNQVKSSRMDGYFRDGTIDSARCNGNAQCIYFIQDDDSAYTGINESKSDILDLYFANKELNKVVFRSAVSGTIWPIRQKNPREMRLPGFLWLEDRRPKSKFDLME